MSYGRIGSPYRGIRVFQEEIMFSMEKTGSCPRDVHSRHYLAICLITLYTLIIFFGHISQEWTFIGNSDRLETFLNIKIAELHALAEFGRVPAWNEYAFMGFSMHGLHWMLPGFDLLTRVASMFPLERAIYIYGIISFIFYTLAGISAYAFFYEETRDCVASTTTAVLYISSYISIIRIAQVDNAFLVLLLVPLTMLILKRMADDINVKNFVSLVTISAILTGYCFLQEVSYAFILFGCYSLYVSWTTRRFKLFFIPILALLAGIAIAAPRLTAVINEFSHMSRPSANMNSTGVFEILRWFQDGFFGRTWFEGQQIKGTHVHEGVQIFTSSFVPLLLLPWLSAPRSRFAWVAASAFYFVFLTALTLTFRLSWQMALLPLLLWGALTVVMSTRTEVRNTRIRDRDDQGFYALFSALLLAAIVLPPMRKLVYLIFLKQDFLHSRLSGIATLCILSLTAKTLSRAAGEAGALGAFTNGHRLRALSTVGVAILFGLACNQIEKSMYLSGVFAHIIPDFLHIVPAVLVKFLFITAVFTVFLFLYCKWRNSTVRKAGVIFTLSALMVVDAGQYVVFQLEGPQDRSYPIPFAHHNFFVAPVQAFHVPSGETLNAVRTRLEADQYRSVFVSDPTWTDTHPASFIAQFWRLRFVEGYSPAVPERLARMPWSQGEHQLRSIRFPSLAALPWKLLGYLNVKYAIQGDLPFYYNLDKLNGDAPFSAEQLRLIENPLPVSPRVFFTHRVEPPRQATSEEKESGSLVASDGTFLPDNPEAISVVEGIATAQDFPAGEPITLHSEGDRVFLTFPPSDTERFLVLNELYTPDWVAESDRGQLLVRPTNVAMRGVLVPPGLSSVTMVFRSRLFSPIALIIACLGLALTIGGALFIGPLKRLTLPHR